MRPKNTRIRPTIDVDWSTEKGDAQQMSKRWVKAVGDEMAMVKENRDLTYDDLEEKMGTSRSTISSWIAGDSNPAFASVIRFAYALDIDPGNFLDRVYARVRNNL